MNETLQVIFDRFSCRGFIDRQPTDEQLKLIAKAGVAAPSAMNRQPWRVIIVKNKALIQEMDDESMRILSTWEDKSAYDRFMARGGALYYHTPAMFMLLKQPGTDLDLGILCQNIALAADSLGLNSLICGMAGIALSGDKGLEFKERMGFPEGYEFGIAVLVGHAEASASPHEPDMSKISVIE